jgi:hypothetical protein
LRVQVERGRSKLDLYSILHRPEKGPIEVIYRSRSVPALLPTDSDGSGGDGNEERPPCVGTRLNF